MTPAQTQLYFRTWHAAARSHGWNTVAALEAALARHHAGEVWESPSLNKTLTSIYQLAESSAHFADRAVTADDLRHACALVAGVRHSSCKAFTNSDLDKILALLRLLANPANLNNQLAAQNPGEAGERRRHIYLITQADAPYWQRIARDKFGHAYLDRLNLSQLRQLSLTIRNRVASRTKTEHHHEHQEAVAA